MSKEILKQDYIEREGKVCSICGKIIHGEYLMFDTDRIIPKAKNGNYDEENYRIAHPKCHMKRHGNLRTREDYLEELKALIDDREQIRKIAYKISNQMLAYERKTDYLNMETVKFLHDEEKKYHKLLENRNKRLKKYIKEISLYDKLVKSALGVKGIGEVTIAYCINYIDLEKARHASSLWKYTGLHTSSHERYVKGESSGGNKNLRTVLYTMADSQVKTRGAYREVYDRAKAKKENSTEMVQSRNTIGKMIECQWKDTKPCHRHGHALRVVMKHFLADYWYVGRTVLGLPTSPLYPEAVLKSGHRTIMPEERGWIY